MTYLHVISRRRGRSRAALASTGEQSALTLRGCGVIGHVDQSDRDDERLLAGGAADGDGGGDGGLQVSGADGVLGVTGEAAVGLSLLDGDDGRGRDHLQARL